jgi:hypothetical protein
MLAGKQNGIGLVDQAHKARILTVQRLLSKIRVGGWGGGVAGEIDQLISHSIRVDANVLLLSAPANRRKVIVPAVIGKE